MTRKGTGYLGSNKVEVSTSNLEVVPPKKENWTHGYSLYKFEWLNFDDATIILNHETRLFRLAGQGFKMDEHDKEITSFVIVESGVKYQWSGNY